MGDVLSQNGNGLQQLFLIGHFDFEVALGAHPFIVNFGGDIDFPFTSLEVWWIIGKGFDVQFHVKTIANGQKVYAGPGIGFHFAGVGVDTYGGGFNVDQTHQTRQGFLEAALRFQGHKQTLFLQRFGYFIMLFGVLNQFVPRGRFFDDFVAHFVDFAGKENLVTSFHFAGLQDGFFLQQLHRDFWRFHQKQVGMAHQAGKNCFGVQFILVVSGANHPFFYRSGVLFGHAFDFAVDQSIDRDVAPGGPAFFAKSLLFGYRFQVFKIYQPYHPGGPFFGGGFDLAAQVEQGVEGTFPHFYFGENFDQRHPIVAVLLEGLHGLCPGRLVRINLS